MLSGPRITTVRRLTLVIVLLAISACTDPVAENTLQRSRDIPKWYDDAKLGIFIHWGPASVPAFAFGHRCAPAS